MGKLGRIGGVILNLIYPKFIDPKFAYYLWQHLLTFDKSTWLHPWQENIVFFKKSQIYPQAALNGLNSLKFTLDVIKAGVKRVDVKLGPA